MVFASALLARPETETGQSRAGQGWVCYLEHFIDLRYFIVDDVDHVAKNAQFGQCQLPIANCHVELASQPELKFKTAPAT